jgi:oligoendopeptidase F
MNKSKHKLLSVLLVGLMCSSILVGCKENSLDTFNPQGGTKKTTEDKKQDNKEVKPKIDYTKYIWNLGELYKSDEEWNNDLKKFEKDMKELKNYKGKFTKSPTHLSFALGIKEKLDIKIEKLYAYINLKKDINKANYRYLDMTEKFKQIDIEYSQICSNLELELIKASDKQIQKITKDKNISKKYGMYIKEIMRNKSRYLKEESEEILGLTGMLSTMPRDVYELFTNMDKKSTLNPAQYSKNMQSKDRELRKKTFQNEFVLYNDNINTISGLLSGQVNKNIFYSKVRDYDSAMEMYLSYDNVNPKVYNNLISSVDKNLKYLHKYVALRKEVLNLDKVYYYDMFVPLTKEVEQNIPYDKAQDIVYSALKPLGKEYNDTLYRAFNERWIDVYSNKDKVSGAYSSSVYSTHPYVLLNYNGTLNSVSTLAHELGHAVHGYMSAKNQNYTNYRPSIVTAEVASITNESLLYESLIKNAANKEQKAYYISQYLDLIKDTLYTQTMYAEFEKIIHEKSQKGEPVNVLVMNDTWGSLLKKYYGKDFEVEPLAMVGWSRIPHFYNSFYVYKYATGCAAAVSFSQDILNNSKGTDNYMAFLSKGGSNYPIDILKQSGINLNSDKPIEKTLNKFESLVKELDALLK